jgi:dienelactone hydrolase
LIVCVFVVGLVVALLFGIAELRAARQEQAQIDRALAQAEAQVAKDNLSFAFTTLYPLSRTQHARDNPRFAKLWQQIVTPIRPLVTEAGASIYFKPYEDVSGDWILAGISPLTEWIEAPLATLRVKVEKPGFRTGYFTIAVPGPSVETSQPLPFTARPGTPIPLPLIADRTLPDDMVLVPQTNVPVYLSGWILDLFGGQQYDIPAFAIARNEVTNREYKEFIDAGGYNNAQYWEGLKFESHGRSLSEIEARAQFVDTTNRVGPAGWQLSTYPRDQADLPVGGVSWYEAVAYARFRGQQLPTIHHWTRAAFSPFSALFYTTPAIAGASHFSSRAPVAARSEIGLGPWGTYNMLGNVREWVTNFSGHEAIALGSSWAQFPADSNSVYVTDPMLRAPDHGIRLMQTLSDTPIDARLLAPIKLVRDTFALRRGPVSDDAFNAMRFQFSTAKSNPIEVTKHEILRTELYFVEEVTLSFARDAPTTLYIARPAAKQQRPLQAIVYGPGGNCCFAKRPNRDITENLRDLDLVAISGRALVMPIWAGSYERFTPMPIDAKERSDRGQRAALAWHRDLRLTLDYLESQPEFDAAKFGYLGYSGGATFQGTLLAIEERIKAAVFVSGGINLSANIHPMIDMVNYAPRIHLPVLMLNGRYDHHHPLEQSQNRLFKLLSTPQGSKQHIVYDTGHFAFQRNTVVAELSTWFDRYLGAVR